MKALLFAISMILLAATGAQAQQRLVIGEKAPEIRVVQWDGASPSIAGKPYLVDFFLSSNDQCVANLPKLNSLQSTHKENLNVIVIARESADKVQPFINGKGYGFYTGLDDGGKTFSGYGVRFVPFAALVDARGRLVWTGNVAGLTPDIIDKALK